MFTINVEKECGCFKRSAYDNNMSFESKDDALLQAKQREDIERYGKSDIHVPILSFPYLPYEERMKRFPKWPEGVKNHFEKDKEKVKVK